MDNMRLKFGGKEFDLKPLNLNDWIAAEDLGLDMQRMSKKEVKIRDMRTIVFVACKKAAPEDVEVTEEWVGENLDFKNTEVFKQVQNFIGSNTPSAEQST